MVAVGSVLYWGIRSHSEVWTCALWGLAVETSHPLTSAQIATGFKSLPVNFRSWNFGTAQSRVSKWESLRRRWNSIPEFQIFYHCRTETDTKEYNENGWITGPQQTEKWWHFKITEITRGKSEHMSPRHLLWWEDTFFIFQEAGSRFHGSLMLYMRLYFYSRNTNLDIFISAKNCFRWQPHISGQRHLRANQAAKYSLVCLERLLSPVHSPWDTQLIWNRLFVYLEETWSIVHGNYWQITVSKPDDRYQTFSIFNLILWFSKIRINWSILTLYNAIYSFRAKSLLSLYPNMPILLSTISWQHLLW